MLTHLPFWTRYEKIYRTLGICKSMFVILIIVLLSFSSYAHSGEAGSVIVVNTQNSYQSIKHSHLKSIFELKLLYWNNKVPIQIVSFQKSDVFYTKFVSQFLDLQGYQLSRRWSRLRYMGVGRQPIFVNNINEMIATIEKIPGAIGYLPHDIELPDTVKEVSHE